MNDTLRGIILTVGAAAAATLVLFLLRAGALRWLKLEEQRHGRGAHRVAHASLRVPSILWAIALGILLGLRFSPLPPKYELPARQCVEALLLFSITVALAQLLEALIRNALERRNSPMASSGLIKGVIRSGVYTVGVLIILSQLGIHIGPLLTALGIGGLAAALAFKDTAENMISGIQLLIDRSVVVGDFIKLESGQEGTVEDIGWRTSKVSIDDDFVLIIPNTKLAQNITLRRKKAQRTAGARDASLYRSVQKPRSA